MNKSVIPSPMCYDAAPSGGRSESLPFFAGDSLSNAELLEYVENTGPLSSLSDLDPSTKQTQAKDQQLLFLY